MAWQKDIEENIRTGFVELLVLQLLCERDMYGYEIKQMMSDRTDGAFVIKEASLYGPLYRMASRGLISSHKEMAGEKRFRMYYHIEDLGREYLKYGREQAILVFNGALKLLDQRRNDNKDESNG